MSTSSTVVKIHSRDKKTVRNFAAVFISHGKTTFVRLSNSPISKPLFAFGRKTILREPRRRGSGARGTSPFAALVTRPRRGGRRVVEVGESLLLQRMSHDTFESPNHILVFIGDQRERVAGALRASRATDAMDVGVGGIGHVVVDNVRDAVNVETARRDVGSDHDMKVSRFESVKRALALSLRTVAVQACDAKSRVRDLFCHFVGAMFRARENQHGIRIDLFEQFQQQFRFQMLRHGI